MKLAEYLQNQGYLAEYTPHGRTSVLHHIGYLELAKQEAARITTQSQKDLLVQAVMNEMKEIACITGSSKEIELALTLWHTVKKLVDSIEIKEQPPTLEEMRQGIDDIDKGLLQLLQKRMQLVRQVGEHKKKHGIEAHQPNRWEEVLMQRTQYGLDLGLSRALVHALWESIHQESLHIEERVIQN